MTTVTFKALDAELQLLLGTQIKKITVDVGYHNGRGTPVHRLFFDNGEGVRATQIITERAMESIFLSSSFRSTSFNDVQRNQIREAVMATMKSGDLSVDVKSTTQVTGRFLWKKTTPQVNYFMQVIIPKLRGVTNEQRTLSYNQALYVNIQGTIKLK